MLSSSKIWWALKIFTARLLRKLFGLSDNSRLFKGLSLIGQGIEVILSRDRTSSVPKDFSISSYLLGKPTGLGINIAGYVRGEFGLGAGVRSNIMAVDAARILYAVNNFHAPTHSNLDDSVKNLSTSNPYPVNLIHMDPFEADRFRREAGDEYFHSKINVGYWAWELSQLPVGWLDRIRDYDEIWVPSSYCLATVSQDSPVPTIRIPHCISVDEKKLDTCRSRFGLKDDSYVFLFTFDFHSSFQRKNPLALIRAFQMAFEDSKDVVCVIKCINSAYHQKEYQALRESGAKANVKIIDVHLRENDLSSLLASCDCFVSLHRSEGFGLPIAEAMYLGKPAIATGYSGNMDFMNVGNSFLVKFKLVDVRPGDYHYFKEGCVWAEPDVDHAADLMRFVYESRQHATKVGEKAREDMRKFFSPAVVGQAILNRLGYLLEEDRDQYDYGLEEVTD